MSRGERVRVAVGGLREKASDKLDLRKRVIEGGPIFENRRAAVFAFGADDFRPKSSTSLWPGSSWPRFRT